VSAYIAGPALVLDAVDGSAVTLVQTPRAGPVTGQIHSYQGLPELGTP
jgi:hypothetical protein